MGMEIVSGRDFSRDVSSDSANAILVNETMVRRMAWENPINKKFVSASGVEKRVVGVVKDFNQNSLYDKIEPITIVLGGNLNNVFLRTNEGDIRVAMNEISLVWKEVNPNYPFEFQFLDQNFDSKYRVDERCSKIFTIFSGLSLAIACLGLLGLAAFTTEQRTKEIGIRKVVGANIFDLILLVSKEFFILVELSTLIAFPVAWYFTSEWLQSFAFRINLSGQWGSLIIASAMSLSITFLTVGFHVIRAAHSNPIRSLRSE